jgi:hypothetical protein
MKASLKAVGYLNATKEDVHSKYRLVFSLHCTPIPRVLETLIPSCFYKFAEEHRNVRNGVAHRTTARCRMAAVKVFGNAL